MAASGLMNDVLNKYFNQVVQMSRDDTSDVVHNVMSEVNRVIQRVNELDPRFSAEPQRVGSYYQKLKVNRADEFDLSIPLLHIGKLFPSKSPRPMRFGFVRKNDRMPVDDSIPTAREDLEIVPKATEQMSPGVEYRSVSLNNHDSNIRRMYQHLTYQDFLIPYSVKLQMKFRLLQAVKDLGLKDAINMDKMLHGPALTISIKHKDIDKQPMRINVDFAVVIPAECSFYENTDWPSRAKRCSWPTKETFDKIIGMGINLVAKKNFHWALSFAECEKALVHHMDADGGIRKKIHRIMKSLWREATNEEPRFKLTTYMLKNAWLWECERYSSSHWTSVRISERFFCCMKRLEEFIQSGSLPVYFNSKMDLLKGKKTEEYQNMMQTVQDMRARLIQFQNNC